MSLDERGVSPVVGTMLLVAVTVVAAGVIAYFVMGLGTPSTAPSANLSAEDDPADYGSIIIAHEAGDDLSVSKTEIAIASGRDATVTSGDYEALTHSRFGSLTGYFEAGESIDVTNDSGGSPIDIGWYHVVIRDTASGSKLLDKNVNVR